jgi:Mrp family chromosome partitioning ATPase
MADRLRNPEFLEKDETASNSGEGFVEAWDKVGIYVSTESEVSPVPAEARVVVYSEKTSAAADRYRLAQIRLKNLQATRKLKSLVITSPLPGDGKSTVALNLATVLSENTEVPVLLLEADVTRPTLLEKLGLKPWPGLTECFRHGDDPMMAVRHINPLGFYLLPAGQPEENRTGILESNVISHFIKGLSSSLFGWILIDSPPTTPTADIVALKALADGTLLVARAGTTPRQAIEESVRNLGHDHILGIILNCVEGLDRVYSKYYGYGKSAARKTHAKPKATAGLGLDEGAK